MIGPILKGKKVILRPIAVKEAADYLRWLKDKNINKFLSTEWKDLNLQKEQEYIKKSRKDKNKINWSIYTKDGEHIGSTGLDAIDRYGKKASWGIFIGEKKYWGQGIATEALKNILKFCFESLKLNRVELWVVTENKGGVKCYRRCGFKKEGIRRQAGYRYGRFWDLMVMGILKNEYQKKYKK
ncbi:MAG: GNAT family protein [Patescibacteria group bacterium]|jgi:RimJ/RimL family protein N-acetyltransferase